MATTMRSLLSRQIGGSLQDYNLSQAEVDALMVYQSTVMNVCLIKKRPRFFLDLPGYKRARAIAHDLAERLIAAAPPPPGRERYLDVMRGAGRAARVVHRWRPAQPCADTVYLQG